MKRNDVLHTANSLVTKDRAEAYGEAHEHFASVGRMWAEVLGVPVTAEQVTICLNLLKAKRAAHDPSKPDNWVDMAGYAALGAEVAEAPTPHTETALLGTPAPVPATTGRIEIVIPPEPIDDADADAVVDDPVRPAKKSR